VALSPTGVIPEALMFPQKLAEVEALLIALPVPGDVKEELLFGWARVVGVKLRESLRRKVRESGIDRQSLGG